MNLLSESSIHLGIIDCSHSWTCLLWNSQSFRLLWFITIFRWLHELCSSWNGYNCPPLVSSSCLEVTIRNTSNRLDGRTTGPLQVACFLLWKLLGTSAWLHRLQISQPRALSYIIVFQASILSPSRQTDSPSSRSRRSQSWASDQDMANRKSSLLSGARRWVEQVNTAGHSNTHSLRWTNSGFLWLLFPELDRSWLSQPSRRRQ